MSKNFDQVATVSIDIAAPLADETSFDNLLILGPCPTKTQGEGDDESTVDVTVPIGAYSTISEVADKWEEGSPVYQAALIAFAQNPKPTSVFIAPVYSNEEPTAAFNRAIEVPGWYVCCPAGISDNKILALATAVEATEKMMCYTETAFFTASKAVVGQDFARTMWIFGKETSAQLANEVPENNPYMNVAFVARWLSFQSGSETSAFKVMSGVSPSALTTTELNLIKTCHGNYFIALGGRNISMNGMTSAGEWADVIRFRDWLKNDMQMRVVELFVDQPKIPYSDAGIQLIYNQIVASLAAGQEMGGIAQDRYDEAGNLIAGYTVVYPDENDITATMRSSRQISGFRFSANINGAIHFASIEGNLTYNAS